MLKSLIDSGFDIYIFTVIITPFFYHALIKLGLMLSRKSREAMLILYFSIVAFLNALFIMLRAIFLVQSVDRVPIITRSLVWFITVLGVWIGLGFSFENDKNRGVLSEIKQRMKEDKAFFFSIIILIVLLLVANIYARTNRMVIDIVYSMVCCLVLPMSLVFTVYSYLFIPGKNRSIKRLNKYIKSLSNYENVEGRYSFLKYKIIKMEDEEIQVEVYENYGGEIELKYKYGDVFGAKIEKFCSEDRDLIIQYFDAILEERKKALAKFHESTI